MGFTSTNKLYHIELQPSRGSHNYLGKDKELVFKGNGMAVMDTEVSGMSIINPDSSKIK